MRLYGKAGMTRKTYTGKCHCGSVEFEFDADEITDGLRCTCSICKRLGCVHSMKIPPEDLRLTKGENDIHTYSWGDGEIPFTFCKHCGVYLYYSVAIQSRINLGCVDAVDTFSLNITVFDGKNLL